MDGWRVTLTGGSCPSSSGRDLLPGCGGCLHCQSLFKDCSGSLDVCCCWDPHGALTIIHPPAKVCLPQSPNRNCLLDSSFFLLVVNNVSIFPSFSNNFCMKYSESAICWYSTKVHLPSVAFPLSGTAWPCSLSVLHSQCHSDLCLEELRILLEEKLNCRGKKKKVDGLHGVCLKT